jgi:hypothetical protein
MKSNPQGRRAGALILAASTLCLGACSVSAFVAHPDQESKYDAAWSTDWQQIVSDQQPLTPSPSFAGVCNAGGSEQGCYETDLKLISDFRKLGSDLSGSAVPSEFARANTTLHQGIADEIQGFSDRNQVIASQDPNATFSKSNQELEVGLSVCKEALGEYRGPKLPADPFK